MELEEFVALRNTKSADEPKLFISARTSTVRLPYERFSADVKRTCILIATTNVATFLGDFSGERRYLPVKVNSENIELPIIYVVEKFPVRKLSQEKNIVILFNMVLKVLLQKLCIFLKTNFTIFIYRKS